LGLLYAILLLILASFGISYILIPGVIAFSNKMSLKDEAGKRKRHANSVSALGGVVIFFVFLVSYFLFISDEFASGYYFIPLSVLLIFATGVYDDIKPLNASKKFLFQIVSACILVFLADVHFGIFFIYFGVAEIFVKVFSVVFIVFIVNAYNLVDGINGLSALLSMIALLGFGIWFFLVNESGLAFVAFAIVASLFAFLRYNLFNTSIFLGDNGSMVLGLCVALFSIKFVQINVALSALNDFKLLSPFGVAVAAMAIPVFDTVRLFVIRPFYLQKSPFKADRNHLHHLLLRLGLTHIQSTFILGAVATVLFLFAFFAQAWGNMGVIFISFFACMALLIALDYFIFNFYRRGLAKKTVFNEALKIREELGNPVVYEFFFGLSFFILAIAIPFHRVSSSIPTILIIFSFIVLIVRNFIVFKNDFKQIFSQQAGDFLKHNYTRIVILFILIYFINIIVMGSNNGWQNLSLKILLLLYWLTLFHLEKIIKIKPQHLITAYLYGCLGFSIFILYQSFMEFNKLGWESFFYSDLLNHVKANPITHSLYYNLAIIFLGNNFQYLKTNIWKLVYVGMLFLFIVMVVLFASKIGYIVLFLSTLTAFIQLVKPLKYRLVLIGVFLLSVGFSYQYVDYVNKKVKGFKWQLEKHEKIPMEHQLPRAIIWPEAVEIVKENWILGVGVGNSVSVLIEKYEVIGYDKGIRERFNAHNQFLETFMQTGILGFLLLIGFFLYGFYKAIVHRNKLYAVFLVIVLFYMMIESLFETQMGMVGFAFFNALFLSALRETEKTESSVSVN
jgi:UDP-GlcNAc:undecaprenyl-phosphate/decaprenyl-phosphate GlcNAc-1-phosphate transferase